MTNRSSPYDIYTSKKSAEKDGTGPSEAELIPNTITRGSPASANIPGAVNLGNIEEEQFKDVDPLIIQSLIDGSSVSLQGYVSNINLGWNSNWNEEVVYGRIDPIPTYSNTTRTVSITVQLVVPAALSKSKKLGLSMANMEKLNLLANMCYPGYDLTVGESSNIASGVLKSAPLVNIKYGNVISGQENGPENEGGFITAYIKNLSVDFQTEGLYSLGIQSQKFFRKISVSLDFGVIHTHNVGYDSNSEKVTNRYTVTGYPEEDTIKYPFNFDEG